MKFLIALASLVTAAAAAPAFKTKAVDLNSVDIKADSKLGNSLMSQARKLEQNDDEVDFEWVAGYSIKFQGCHHISQWNEEADGEEDVRIETKRLVRFRLCPTDYCSAENAGGCSDAYGDYVIDMNTYLMAYFQAVEDFNEYKCEYLEQMVCGCGDDDGNNNNGDDWDEDKCLWDCYEARGMEEICMEDNPYVDDDQDDGDQFELEAYMECAQADIGNDNRRQLNQEEVEYFIGPYCAEQGGVIYLGMFTDDACTVFADDYGGKELYLAMAGEDLPYAESSLVGPECMSCMEPAEIEDNDNGNDNQDEDQVIEVCEELYRGAGKCEQGMGLDYPNNNACNYMEGIKIIRKNGTVTSGANSANKTVSIFIGVFVVAFVLLAAYVYYLKTKLDRASINLSE